MQRTPLSQRVLPNYTRANEIANMTTHIIGAAMGVVIMLAAIFVSVYNKNVWGLVSSVIYASTVILLFSVSSIYHGLKPEYAKKVMQVIDHSTIFFLICGTYTPILLSAVRVNYPFVAWLVFGFEWGLAIFGAVLTSIDHKKYSKVAMLCYIGMGWFVVFALGPTVESIGIEGFLLILLGGVLYTVGAVLYSVGKKHSVLHTVFHVFVDVACIIQAYAIIRYAL